jgi:hypothetical protein
MFPDGKVERHCLLRAEDGVAQFPRVRDKDASRTVRVRSKCVHGNQFRTTGIKVDGKVRSSRDGMRRMLRGLVNLDGADFGVIELYNESKKL